MKGKKKDIVRMVEELNEACKNSLTITRYSDGWVISSYEGGSFFHAAEKGWFGMHQGMSFEQVVEKALCKIKEK